MKINVANQNVYFISDFHFYHTNIIKFDNRPFRNVDEMNETLVGNWNDKIRKEDVVFYLGDLSWDGSGPRTKELVNELNGSIHYIMGNHDKFRDIKALNRFETINDYVELSVPDKDANRGSQEIMLFHYAIMSWDKAHHSSWHCHAHEHQHLTKNPAYDWYYKNKVLDVGCNGWDYTPLSYSEVKEIMKTREVMKIHH